MGRKTVPTAIKAAMGNPGKRPLNKNEPGREVDLEIPAVLIDDEIAIESFLSLGRLLITLGMLKDAFHWIVVEVAKLESNIRLLEVALKDSGRWTTGKNGGIVIDQRAWLLKTYQDQRDKYMIELGLTPSACAKLFALTPGASAMVGKGYAEQKLKQIDLSERKEDNWQPPIEVAG